MSILPPPVDLLDLKFLPAWVNEPSRPNDYANFEGEEVEDRRGAAIDRGPDDATGAPRRGPRRSERRRARRSTLPSRWKRQPGRAPARPPARHRGDGAFSSARAVARERHRADQIRLASPIRCFALARLFLEKPERYDVRLHDAGRRELFQLGETGRSRRIVDFLEVERLSHSRERRFLQDRRCRRREPLKGNFHERRAVPAQRHVARSDESSQLSGATAQSLRAALQPADEFR